MSDMNVRPLKTKRNRAEDRPLQRKRRWREIQRYEDRRNPREVDPSAVFRVGVRGTQIISGGHPELRGRNRGRAGAGRAKLYWTAKIEIQREGRPSWLTKTRKQSSR